MRQKLRLPAGCCCGAIGVVFRDVLARETTIPRWRDLLGMFRRLEAQGSVRGGRFLSGFGGEQFAIPEAVVSLRSWRAAHPYRGGTGHRGCSRSS